MKVKRIEPLGRRFRVVFEHAGREHVLDANRIVNGAGRVADVNGLDLAAAKVDHKEFRVAVDEYLRSVSNANVHLCGDLLWETPQLSPVATYEGGIVGRNIVEGPKHKPSYASIPSCVCTLPSLASVGFSEAKAKEKGLRFQVQTHDVLNWLSARTYGEAVAWAKVLVEEAADRILGAQMVGHASEELIHIFRVRDRAWHNRGADSRDGLCIPYLLGGHQEHGLKRALVQ